MVPPPGSSTRKSKTVYVILTLLKSRRQPTTNQLLSFQVLSDFSSLSERKVSCLRTVDLFQDYHFRNGFYNDNESWFTMDIIILHSSRSEFILRASYTPVTTRLALRSCWYLRCAPTW